MNIFRKVKRSESGNNEWKLSGSFVKKPIHGWIHPDHQLQSNGVTYQLRYIGAVKILESMRTVDFTERGDIVREAIAKCCFESNLFNFKQKKVAYTHGIVGDVFLRFSGQQVTSKFSTKSIETYVLSNGRSIANHVIENISFASIGEQEYKNLVGYISKDEELERACYVLECENNLADDIILTIGQAFELKYKEYLNVNPVIQPVISRNRPRSISDPPPTRDGDDYVNLRDRLKLFRPFKKFTDPSNNSRRSQSPRPHSDITQPFGDLNGKSLELDKYNHLIIAQPKKNNLKQNGKVGYDTLMHRNQTLSSSSFDNMNFTQGASYGTENDVATVYDNPIACLNAKQQQKLFSPKLDDVFYDNPQNQPLPPIPTSENDSSHYMEARVNNDEPYVSGANSNVAHENPYQVPSESNDLKRKSWFHGAISRDVAETFIKRDGDFLVREKLDNPSQFILSGMKDHVHRHLLLVDPQGVVRTRDHTFKSVPELIRFHTENSIPIYSGGSGIDLTNEITVYNQSFAL